MSSPWYVIGALDALVKAGEVSPDYAGGVVSALAKRAGLFRDSSFDDVSAAAQRWIDANPGMQMTPDVAKQILDDNKQNWFNFGTRGGADVWDTVKNRVGAWTTGWNPFANSNMTKAVYDRRLENASNEGDLAMIKEWERSGKNLPPQMAAALQDAHMRDAGFVEQDAKTYMTEGERAKAGFTEGKLSGKFRTQAGDMAVNAGSYKPGYFKSNKPDPAAPAYGKNLSKQYGANSDLVYQRNYTDPTAI